MTTEAVTWKQIESYARRIERDNLHEHGTSMSAATFLRRANPYIVDIRSDEGVNIMKKGWRKAMRRNK
jgi:hypothetical protein